jgi:hypothetical protein
MSKAREKWGRGVGSGKEDNTGVRGGESRRMGWQKGQKHAPFAENAKSCGTRKFKGWPTLYDEVGSVKRQVECASCGQLVFVLT